MRQDLFYSFGTLIYKTRYFIILLWLIFIAICVPFTSKIMEPFKAIGFVAPGSESDHANQILNKELGYSYNQYIVLYHSEDKLATDAKYINEIKRSLSDLKKISVKHQIIYPTVNNKQIQQQRSLNQMLSPIKCQQT